jgi:hypothetical protein
MLTAMIYPNPERGRGKKDGAKKSQESCSFSRERLQRARQVLHHSEEMAMKVASGDLPLDEALKLMNDQQMQTRSTDAQLERLKQSAPDLFELVNEGRMNLGEAIAASSERQAQLQEIRKGSARDKSRRK